MPAFIAFPKLSRAIMIVGLSIICVNAAQASWWNPFSWFSGKKIKRIDTLLITGNYVKSRVLVELIQMELKQPILLLPTGEEGDSFFFLAHNRETFQVKREDYPRFINFLQPKKVMFIGNQDYCPHEYMDIIKEQVPVWSIPNDNWEMIAFSVGDVLKVKKLGFDYMVLQNQLDAGGKIKPPATTDVFGGYMTNRKYWTPPAQ